MEKKVTITILLLFILTQFVSPLQGITQRFIKFAKCLKRISYKTQLCINKVDTF